MIKAVIFDLDNTLVDSTETIWRDADFTMRSRGFRGVKRGDVEKVMGLTLYDLFREVEPAMGDSEMELLFHAYKDNYMNFLCHSKVLPHARQTLEGLRSQGYRLALVTTKSRENAVRTLEAFGLADCFEVVQGFEDTVEHKPSPQPILKAASSLGLTPGEVIVIGDADADVKAAKAAGARVVAVTTGVTPLKKIQECNPDYIIADLSALPRIIGETCGKNEG